MKEKAIGVTFALLIVTSGFGGFVQPASAVHDCSSTDALVYGFSFGAVNKDKCTNNHVAHAVEDVRDAEANQTKTDIYSALSGQQARNENFNAVYSNYLNDSDSIAWMKAEQAIAEAYENGSTKAEAKVAAKDAISNYYAVKQVNLIESWDSIAAATKYMRERANQESGISQSYVHAERTQGSADFCNWGNESLTLVNGSTHQARNVGITGSVTNGDCENYGSLPTGASTHQSGYTFNGAVVEPPDSNYNASHFWVWEPYKKKWDSIKVKNSELQNESDAFVDAIWQDLQDGNANSTDIISRTNRMFMYGSDAQNGSNFYDVIGATAAMGLSTPELEGTGTMTIEVPASGNQYEGMLFARNVPNGTWEVGKTYNPDNIVGPVQFGTTDGQLMELERNFTVTGATNKDGDSVSTVETVNYNYQTSNTSELNDKYSELLNLTQELEDRQDAIAGGGSTGDSGTSGNLTIPDWLTKKYAGIPLYGFIGVGLAALYVFNNRRE